MSSSDDQNSVPWLLEKLKSVAVGATQSQVDLVAASCRVYEGNRVLRNGLALPLHCACPDANDCWSRPSLVRPPREEASVSVPWVGASYRRGGLTAIGINMNAFGGLGAQWWKIRGAIRKLEGGQRVQFYFRAGAYFASVLRALAHDQPNSDPTPESAAIGWEGCSFLEAVKCSPIGSASRPEKSMWKNCPPRYLEAELEVLAPRVVLTLGVGVGNVAQEMPGFTQTDDGEGFARGVATVADTKVEILRCRHPGRSERLWRASYDSLHASLERHPLT